MNGGGRPLALEMSCQVVGNSLQVRYKTTNTGTTPLLTYDGAPGDPKQEWPDLAQQVNASFQAPATLHLKRIRAPLPPGQRIAFIRVPAVYRLQPSQSRQVRFSVPVPMTERSEYFPDSSAATYEVRRATSVQLWIGYFKPTDETKLQLLEGDGNTFHPSGKFTEQAFASASAPVTLEVRVRTDEKFQRV